jgi:hypothetical protein
MTDFYIGAIGVEFRIDTGYDLAGDTLLQLKLRKPSGEEVNWTATAYDTTTLTYTTVSGDLDEAGTWTYQSYVEIGGTPQLPGNAETFTVLNAFTANEIDDIQRLFSVFYRYINVQSRSEAMANTPTNTDADISYDNFGTYLELAEDELVDLLRARSIPSTWMTDKEENLALCHLCAHYFEQGNPDWSYASQSQSPGVSFSRGRDKDGLTATGARLALEKLLDQVEIAVKRSGFAGGRRVERLKIKDSKNYPRRWKRSDIMAFSTFDGDSDATEVKDLGQGVYDQNQQTSIPW